MARQVVQLRRRAEHDLVAAPAARLLRPRPLDQIPGYWIDPRPAAFSAIDKTGRGRRIWRIEGKPNLDENWIIHWVRGPRTAVTLGLPARLGLGDPAVLTPRTLGLQRAQGQYVGFMPHFESASWGAWQQAADHAGVRLIDPRDPPLAILQAIGGCTVLLSEALHGVIVADALRVPWIAIRPMARIHRPKWFDWAETMDLRPRFGDLAASTLLEWAATSRLSSLHATRTWLERDRAERNVQSA
jgi:succinoglycan biosynthesis protein ExoV